MKSFFILLITITGFALSLVSPLMKKKSDEAARLNISELKKNAIGCSTDWTNFRLTNKEVDQMIPLPGTGSHTWIISTKHDSAQFYFNQGINLYYGFHIIESIPSFKKAQRFDSTAAILYWAEALAYGPNINDLSYAALPEALVAAEKAVSKMETATEKEKALIQAIRARYSADSTRKQEVLNQQYANAMATAFKAFGNDAEIGALYADALMLLHPWDLWLQNGNPRPWTNEIVTVLEKVLQTSPDHPGANHYYIHAVEASPNPGKAAGSADRLGRLTPGLSHMVHMPSHIYIRTGQYDKGNRVNKEAVLKYKKYLELYPLVANNAPLYDFHNRHMQAACSLNGNEYSKAIKDALECRTSFDTSFLSLPAPMGPFIQFVYMTPDFTRVQFERWQEIIKNKQDYTHSYAALLQQFSLGMAYANTAKPDLANTCLQQMKTLINHPDLAIPFSPFNAPKAGGGVALEILEGTILEKTGKAKQAIAHYETAVALEDAMIYNEPKDWILHARQFLGKALLSMQEYTKAAKVFRDDLKQHPNNFTSTTGLQTAMQKQGKKSA